jgi:transposase
MPLTTIANTRPAVTRWVHRLPAGTAIGLEATNHFHRLVADLAQAAGHTVYVLNPKALKH